MSYKTTNLYVRCEYFLIYLWVLFKYNVFLNSYIHLITVLFKEAYKINDYKIWLSWENSWRFFIWLLLTHKI